jgi:hypothetical protein
MEPTNPYEAPKSAVADTDLPPAPREKPRQVVWATSLIWITIAMGLLNVVLLPSVEDATKTWIIVGITFAIIAALTVFISLGHNWARIVFLVLFVIGLLPSAVSLPQVFAQSLFMALLSLLQMLLQGAAMVFVFTRPGSLWFRRARG